MRVLPGEALKRRYEHILVPLDGSEVANVALRTANVLAADFGATVHTLSVASTASDLDRLRDTAANALGVHQADERVRAIEGDDPARAINDRADELGSCLVCMTTHGHGRVVGSFVGSVTRSVIRGHPRPLVVVGRLADRKDYFEQTWPEPLATRHIVACVDDTVAADAAVMVAAEWADALAMSLTILTVSVPPISLSGDERSDDLYSSLQRLRDLLVDRSLDVRTHVQSDPLGAAAGVSTYLAANPAGLLVLSTHARSGLSRLVGGATATSIVAASRVATVVVPGLGDAAGPFSSPT
ncbi:MAG: universal stress protein [Ilumatobacteraceae bacterium]